MTWVCDLCGQYVADSIDAHSAHHSTCKPGDDDMSIQRYEMEPDCTLEPMNAEMQRSGIGDWVLYADHLAALTAERERADTLKAANWQAAILHGETIARAEKAEAELTALRERVARLVGAIEQIEQRTRPGGDMADLAVNELARTALGDK